MSKIDTLHPLIREVVRRLVVEANEKLLTSGVKMLVTLCTRTFSEQNDLYAQGRTKKGKIITNAKGGQSFHNYGLAFDFCLVKDGVTIWETGKDFDGDGVADWKEVANLFIANGFEWGGNFRSISDAPHFQRTFGLSWQTLKNRYDAGLVDKAGFVRI